MPAPNDDIAAAPRPDPEWFTGDDLAARYSTTLRTILRWVQEKRIPPPSKFGKLSRWSRDVVRRLDREGVGRPLAQESAHFPPLGLVTRCPCCEAEIRVKRDGTAEPVSAAPAGPEPTAEKKPQKERSTRKT